LPNNFNNITSFIKLLDGLMRHISHLLSPTLFPFLKENAAIYDIPLLDSKFPWGMFDITKYHNDGTRKDINCFEHTDPGLLSLHLRSTESGLQLRDENKMWHSVLNTNNIAVLWTGDIANKINQQIKPCVHRVLNTNKSRIALWYEICTKGQERKELLNKQREKFERENKTGIPPSKTVSRPLNNSMYSFSDAWNDGIY
jgi:hypothetical protein